MEDSLEEVTLTRIFAVEKFQKLKNKFLIDDLFADARLEVGRLEETEEELVYELQGRSEGSEEMTGSEGVTGWRD